MKTSKVTTAKTRPVRFRNSERFVQSLGLHPVVKSGVLYRGDFQALAIDGHGKTYRVTADGAKPITPAESVRLFIDAESYDNRRIREGTWPRQDFTVATYGIEQYEPKRTRGRELGRDAWLRSLAGGVR
jgi:hypothetical protein